MNLHEVWEQLENDTGLPEGLGRVQRRVEPSGTWDFFLGLEMPFRRRMLIMRVASTSVDANPNVPDSRGLVVRISGRDSDSPETDVELILLADSYREIFDRLILDLIEAAGEAEDEPSGVSRFLQRLASWQHLLRVLVPGGLSRKDQQGLWGELWVLREVIGPIIGTVRATQAWQGPLGDDQDFHIGRTAIEVKTRSIRNNDRLIIASERQLEVPEDIALVIVAISLDLRIGHGETLPEMVGRVREITSDAGCLHLLNDRLENIGYVDEDADLYANVGYTVLESSVLRVSEGFPRIVSRRLQSGLSHVSYSISTNAVTPFEIDGLQLREMLE